MIQITDFLNENVKEANYWIEIYCVARVQMPGRKRKTGIECYNVTRINDTKTKGTFSYCIIRLK